MKKILSIGLLLLMITGVVLGGGIVTNTNQSAEFIRSLNRNASTDVDAVYYNPAALTKLSDGYHIYISNQTIRQTRKVTAEYANLNQQEYEGQTFAPVFPNLYLVYKKDKIVFSGGLAPVGGGGSATYNEGLPDFEYKLAGFKEWPASTLNPALAPYGTITGYYVDAEFEGSSVYLGFQGGVSYALNDMISVAAGLRLVSATNTYLGTLKNLTLTNDSGLGDLNVTIMGSDFADKEVDAKRTGTGFTGIFGLNLAPMEGLNIGFRYEHLTKLVMVNETDKDDVGLFPDGAEINSDMPTMITAGMSYQFLPQLRVDAGLNYYLNTAVNWDGNEDKVENGTELGIAFEYALGDNLAASLGFLNSQAGANNEYQSGLSNSLNSSTVGAGIRYTLNEKTALSLGFSNTFYQDAHNDEFDNAAFKDQRGETYGKTAVVFAIGLQYSL